MRIATGCIGHETNTFSSVPTSIDDFKVQRSYHVGDGIISDVQTDEHNHRWVYRKFREVGDSDCSAPMGVRNAFWCGRASTHTTHLKESSSASCETLNRLTEFF